MQNLIYLSLAILVAFFLRVALLIEVPPGLANDELNIIMNAQSFLKTGQNIPGVVTGIFGTSTGDLSGGIHSEISSYLIIPGIMLLGFNLIGVKIVFMLMSIGLVCISYLLVKKIVNTQAGLIAAFLSAVNPWSIHFGRSGYESIFSAFFYLSAIYLVMILKNWKILWSIPLFILGFLSYFSAKTLLLPIIVVTIFTFRFLRPKKSLGPITTVTISIIFFLIIYTPLLQTSTAGTRFQELKNQNVADLVNLKRRTAIDTPFNQIFENKFTEDLRIRLIASLGTISPNLLFLNGQPESIPSLSIPDHGPLFLIDFPLIIFGIVYLARSNLTFLVYILGLITTTLLPNFLNLAGTTYIIRTVILFPFLTILSAVGAYFLIIIPRKLIKIPFIILLIIVYSFSIGNFLYQYFARLPIDRNEGWFFHQRVLTRYVKSSLNENPTTKINIVTEEPKYTFYRYLFFSGVYTDSKEIQKINDKLTSGDYSLPNLVITNKCPDIENLGFTTYIMDVRMRCPNTQGSSIASIKDAGDKYIIVNDKLCGAMVNKRYPLIKNFSKLNIETLSKEDFCQNFITNSRGL